MTDTNKNGDSGGLHFDEEMSERYLFGELSEAEQEQFETAYFADDAFFERFLAVKTELLDLYSRGELAPETCGRMQRNFLATEPRRQKIAESGDFIRAVTAISARAATADGKIVAVAAAPRWIDSLAHFFTLPRLAGAGLLVAVLGGTWLFLRSDGRGVEQAMQEPSTAIVSPANPESEVGATSAASNTAANDGPSPPANLTEPQPDATANPAARESRGGKQKIFPGIPVLKPRQQRLATRGPGNPAKPNEAKPPVNERSGTGFALTLSTVGRDKGKSDSADHPSITLRAGATRAIEETNTLSLRADTEQAASITLVFKSDPHPKYIVTITNIEGKEVWKDDDFDVGVTDDGMRLVVVWMSDTAHLKHKDYIVKLEGRSAAGVIETLEEYYFHVKRGVKKNTGTGPPDVPIKKP